ncbi:MAG: hypothetical protein K9K21_09350 [Desulfotignum sp.]|nr:hypothetical protein [Desulfotignum sp.]
MDNQEHTHAFCLPARTSFQYHLPKMAALPNSANADLSGGFTVAQVAEKYGMDGNTENNALGYDKMGKRQGIWKEMG